MGPVPPPAQDLRRSPSGRRGTWVPRVLLALISTGLTLVLMDCGLRILSVGTPRRGTLVPKPERHRLTSWIEVFQPGYTGSLASREFNVNIRMNSLGFREREFDLKDLAAKRPVVFMGDSYFFGWGVEQDERLSERFASLLASAKDPPGVINLSFPGWSTFQYIEVWKEFVSRVAPRLVIIGCFIGNDFSDDLKQANRGPAALASAEGAPTAGRIGPALREALSTSPVIGSVQHLLWKSSSFRSLFNRLEIHNDRIALYEPNPSAIQTRLYANTESAWATLAGLAREAGIPLLVVLIPDHLQVLSPDLFRGLDAGLPQKRLTEHLAKQGVACLDLLPLMKTLESPDRLFFREDKHWNAAGHRFVATALRPAVEQILGRSTGSQKTPASAGAGEAR